jgi:predicted amidohydrolase YtcJ
MTFSSSLKINVILLGFLLIIPLSVIAQTNVYTSPNQNPISDYIFYNGTILSMEENQPILEAVGVMGDTIIITGNESEVFAFSDSTTEFIDLEGKTLVPGFIDSHSHWIGDRGMTNTTELNDVIESLIKYGWTSISELFVNQYRLNELRATDEAGLLKVRVNCYLPLGYGFDRFGNWYQEYETGHEYSDKLRIAGIKLFADRWYFETQLFFNQTELNQLVQEAHNLDFQISIHSVTTNATDMVLDAFQSVIGNGTNDLRHRIEHLVMLRENQISKLAELGILGCIQNSWFNSDMIDSLEPAIGRDQAVLVGRWKDLLTAGVHLMGSTDYPYVSGEFKTPMESMTSVVTRIGALGETPTDFMLNQTLTPEEALRMLTIDGAFGTFQENEKGSIKAGKYADLVVLSDNPLTVPEDKIKHIEVKLTMIGGEILFVKEESIETSSTTTETSTSVRNPSMTSVPLIIAMILLISYKRKK